MKRLSLFCFALLHMGRLFSQHNTETIRYNSQDFYVPNFQPPPGSLFRSSNGNPGPMYWQNTADYLIHATLDDKTKSIKGDVTISYTNNSPDKLDYLWLQLDQNLFKDSSRGTLTTSATGARYDTKGFDGGFNITGVMVTCNGKTYKAEPIVTDTRMQVRLSTPLLAKGAKLSLTIDYNFSIPEFGSDRLGWMQTDKGVIYEIAQWYPRVCVYDDLDGWNTLPYMGVGEFYCENGNFDYYITAPAAMIVYGSGDLQNASKVLTAEEIRRLEVAAKSDKTTMIINADEVGKSQMRPATTGNLTWHYKMQNTRDVAWVASSALIWDAARINLPSGRKAIAMSAYPAVSMGDTAWSRSTEYLKYSVELYSKLYYEYPWNSAVSIAGQVTGMEYPGMTFNDYREKKAGLWLLISHEIGHSWYPMIVGSNERKYMWLDEGVNTFINLDANDLFNNGEYAKDTLFSQAEYFTHLNIDSLTNRHYPLMILPDAMGEGEIERTQFYSKTAYGLNLVRNVIVGRERFDYAFRKYTEAWAFKHPSPYDFFRSINSGVGEDLNWFWKEWFFTNWTDDQAVTAIAYVDNDPSKGALITIENKGKMILPVTAKIIQVNGEEGPIALPVEIWQRGGTWTFHYPSKTKIKKFILDPENVLPDVDRKNNEWNSGH